MLIFEKKKRWIFVLEIFRDMWYNNFVPKNAYNGSA